MRGAVVHRFSYRLRATRGAAREEKTMGKRRSQGRRGPG